MSNKVLVIGPNGGITVYNSIRATSRVLSGIGGHELSRQITENCTKGGGQVRNNYVQYTNHPGGIRRPVLLRA